MRSVVIVAEKLSKTYRLGQIGTGTFTNDLKLWWAKARGKPNPLLRIGETDHGNRDGEDLWALRDVSFTVEQGEVLGIIGRNGAGKSTLLKILSRVTAPTSGKIKVKGRVASLLEVGTGFHPELTGRENVYLNGSILGMSRREIDRKFDEIVDFSEVEKFIDTPVKRYSSGMYVRLAFAVAAHLDPEILVVDEVLAVGDVEFQKKCLGKMGDVAKQGRTVLFVSHNLGAIQHLCTGCVVIVNGRKVYMGNTEDAISQYLLSSKRNYHQVESIADYRDRDGNGDIKLIKVELKDFNGNVVEFVGVGQSFDVFLHFESRDEYLLSRVNFGFDCYSPMGQRIFIQSLEYSGFSGMGRLPKKGIFVCRLNTIPLPKGKYVFTTVLRLDKTRVDVVEGAFSLNVVDSNFLNSTVSLSLSDVVCVVQGQWRLEENEQISS